MQNKSQIGGILSTISGAIGLLGFLAFIAMIFMLRRLMYSPTLGVGPEGEEALRIVLIVYGVIAFGLLVLSTMGIVGGIYALKRRYWGLALAGAICGTITFLPTGVIATVFIAQAQKEFSSLNHVDTEIAGTRT